MKNSLFQPPVLLLVLLTLLGVLIWFWFHESENPIAVKDPAKPIEPLRAEASPPTSAQNQLPPGGTKPEVVRADGARELQAYRLLVKGGVVTLDGTARIAGDFHRPRGPLPWMPGMWCVRLLDADMRVLAEETTNAPDEICMVGDPQNVGTDGKPKVSQFSGAGEEAMLQVRMQPHAQAKWLKVYRIGSLQRADWSVEPMGQLLTSISLP